MPTLQKSTIARKETTEADWYVIDADARIVGRLATQIATVLMGKHKAAYTPHVDCGDYVVVVNAERVTFGGKKMEHPEIPNYSKKWDLKTYDRYTGYPGGRYVRTATEQWAKQPEKILEEAVRRMLPKTKLGTAMLKKLRLFVGPDHPHQAQQPQPFPEYLLK